MSPSTDLKQKKQVSLNNYFTRKSTTSSPAGAAAAAVDEQEDEEEREENRNGKRVSSLRVSPKKESLDVKNIYACDMCNKSFAYESSLKSHKMFHSSSKSSLSSSPSKRVK